MYKQTQILVYQGFWMMMIVLKYFIINKNMENNITNDLCGPHNVRKQKDYQNSLLTLPVLLHPPKNYIAVMYFHRSP